MKDEKKLFIRNVGNNVEQILSDINFSKDYINSAKNKYEFVKFKICNLFPYEANILKQECLSLGSDCAISRDSVTCRCDYTDALVAGSISFMEKLADKLKKQPFRLKEISDLIYEELADKSIFSICGRTFSKPLIMGILNVTPDSFSDGGQYFNVNNAVEHAFDMVKNGADIIDIGGQSTRPSSKIISADEEFLRIAPVLQKIREKNNNILISVDTFYPECVEKCLKYDINIVNNVNNNQIVFEKLFPVMQNKRISYVLTHSDGVPAKTESISSDNRNIVDIVYDYFLKNIEYIEQCGLNDIILDVGIGFSKNQAENIELIKRAGEFKSLNKPILYGISRKTFMRNKFSDENLDEITNLYDLYLLKSGVNIIRVHDVQKAKMMTDIFTDIN